MSSSYIIWDVLSSLLLGACGLALKPSGHSAKSSQLFLWLVYQEPWSSSCVNLDCLLEYLLDPRSVEIFRRSVELQKSTTFLSTQQIRAQAFLNISHNRAAIKTANMIRSSISDSININCQNSTI